MPIFFIFDFKHFVTIPLTFEMFRPIIELAILCSCAAFILFAYSVSRIGITMANVFSNTIPVFTAVFSFMLIGEKLTIQNAVGMIIVLGGLLMSQINHKNKEIDEALVFTETA